nr:MAG TPA: hypothetical protein [Caudoviricetes sp.]
MDRTATQFIHVFHFSFCSLKSQTSLLLIQSNTKTSSAYSHIISFVKAVRKNA